MNGKIQAHCHRLIADTAKAAAHELYDKLMGSNQLFDEWKRQNPDASPRELERRFVARLWGKCVPVARATLARLLTQAIDPALKEEIYEALCDDATLSRGRFTSAEIVEALMSKGPSNATH
jgi:hypothetical protein